MKQIINKTSQLIDNTLSSNAFFQVNKAMLKYLGSAEASILLSELIYSRNLFKNKGEDENGWWFVTKEYLIEQIGISEYIILKAEKLLESKGILKTQLKGLPRKKYFFINDVLINNIISGCITQTTQDTQPKKINSRTPKNSGCAALRFKGAHPKELRGNNTVDNNTVDNNTVDNNNMSGETLEHVDTLDKQVKPGYENDLSDYTGYPFSEELVIQLYNDGFDFRKIQRLFPEHKSEIVDILL